MAMIVRATYRSASLKKSIRYPLCKLERAICADSLVVLAFCLTMEEISCIAADVSSSAEAVLCVQYERFMLLPKTLALVSLKLDPS